MFNNVVHITPFGYEYDRIIQPVEQGKADVVVLLNNGPEDDVRTEFQDELQRRLSDSEDVELDARECDIFDMYDSMEAIMESISDYENEDVYVNLATGTKVTAVSGMIACMATDAEPFYVQSNLSPSSVPPKSELPGFGGIVELPDYPMEKPSEDQIRVMEYIYDEEGLGESRARKKDIIDFATEAGLEFTVGSGSISEKALYPRLNSHIVDPLRDKGFIDIEEHGNTTRVYLTDEGQKAARAFRHIV